MMSERLRAAVDRAAQLPPEQQDAAAAALEAALDALPREAGPARARPGTGDGDQPQSPPGLAPDVRAAFELTLDEHAASLEYLKKGG